MSRLETPRISGPTTRPTSYLVARARWVALCILMLGWVGPAVPREGDAPASATSLVATLELVGGSLATGSPPPRVVATWYGKPPAPAIEVHAKLGQPLPLPLKPGRWVLEARAPGFWGEPVQVELGEGEVGRVVRLKLWPSATLEGAFTLPAGEEPPPDFALLFRPAPDVPEGKGVPRGRVLCPIVEKKWRCAVPAGLLDLRFHASGFIPRYLWGVDAAPGKTLRVGSAMLARGSAVQGWVVTADGTPLGKDARVTLKPRGAGRVPNLVDMERAGTLAMTTTANDRGFFEIADVPPGEYVLQASLVGFAPATTTVRVVLGQVSEVANPPLLLNRPLVLRGYVDPPVDPWGERWTLQVDRGERGPTIHLSSVTTSKAQSDGSWAAPDLSPDWYLLSLLSSRGEKWWTGDLDLQPGQEPLQIELPIVAVRGRVRLGKKPLAARLVFGGKYGAVRIETSSNDEGEFSLLLPKPGNWRAYVSATEPPVEREIRKVEVSRGLDQREAEVELALSDTVVRGAVVDERGRSMADAIVTLKPRQPTYEPQSQVRTSSDGKFEIRGLPVGSALIAADASADLAADPQEIQLTEGQDSPPLTLVVRERLRVAGFVSSSVGAVAGASVKGGSGGSPSRWHLCADLRQPRALPAHASPRHQAGARGRGRAGVRLQDAERPASNGGPAGVRPVPAERDSDPRNQRGAGLVRPRPAQTGGPPQRWNGKPHLSRHLGFSAWRARLRPAAVHHPIYGAGRLYSLHGCPLGTGGVRAGHPSRRRLRQGAPARKRRAEVDAR